MLTIEVLARLVKHDARLRFEFDELSGVILYTNYNTAAQFIEKRITDILESEKIKKQQLQEIDASFRTEMMGENNA